MQDETQGARDSEEKLEKTLAWFLGPKAENAQFFEEMLKEIFRDYTYWRKNYFPEDPILITKKSQSLLQGELDQIHQNIQDMMAELRRNFPFYSPRYFGHMLSEVAMPSMLAYFAGMLFNPNNVTTEAAPVTAEWEIEASNWLLEMLGYIPSPVPPKVWVQSDPRDIKASLGGMNLPNPWTKYNDALKGDFGWGHITSGGTVANIEALWVARTIKYYPVAVYEAYKQAKEIESIYSSLRERETNGTANQGELEELTRKIKKIVGVTGVTVNVESITEIEEIVAKYGENEMKIKRTLINLQPKESIALLSLLYGAISIELFGEQEKRIEREAKSEIYLREIDELINVEKAIPADLNQYIKNKLSKTSVLFGDNLMTLEDFRHKIEAEDFIVSEAEEEKVRNSFNQIFEELSNTSTDLNKSLAEEIAKKYKGKKDNFDEIIQSKKNDKIRKAKSKRKKEIILNLLSNTKYYTDLPGLMSEFPGYIFYPETAHYSIKKAADILGISRKNLIKINVGSDFRMDVNQLKDELEKINTLDFENSDGKKISPVPIAVIGVFGTTEEGAIDPIDLITKYRRYYQCESVEEINNGLVYGKEKFSFWIHVDAAYGGFFSSILKVTPKEKFLIKMKMLYNGIAEMDAQIFKSEIGDTTGKQLIAENDMAKQQVFERNNISLQNIVKCFDELMNSISRNKLLGTKRIKELVAEVMDCINYENFDKASIILKHIGSEFTDSYFKHHEGREWKIEFEFDEIVERNYIVESLRAIRGVSLPSNDDKGRNSNEEWPSIEVVRAFKAIKHCNSVTIDPHKMGYIQYPCGFVAFKNDRIRNFITQNAPYITTTDSQIEVKAYQTPPRHIAEKNDQGDSVFEISKLAKGEAPTKREDYKIAIEAFASYILEGSKPGAAAAALWLTLKTIKPNRENYGSIIYDTVQASKELYDRIKGWNNEFDQTKEETSQAEEGQHKCRLFPLSALAPDTNVVVFFVAPLQFLNIELVEGQVLKAINRITKQVYDKFTIHAEHGDRKTSYSQPFFLSQTKMEYPAYSFDAIDKLLNGEYNLQISAEEYEENGLCILRASMMNPYIQIYEKRKEGEGKTKLISKFLAELNNAVVDIIEDEKK